MDQVRRNLTRNVMLQNQAEGRTPNCVAKLIGCRPDQVKYVGREYGIHLDSMSGTKKVSWAAKDEFKHRRGLNHIYRVVLSKWVSSSPELRHDHGVA